jgi:drug/metabolite transporter (DMT)-like permease
MRSLSDNARGAALMTAAMAAFVVNDSMMKGVIAEIPLMQAIAVRGIITCAALYTIARWTGTLRLAMLRRDARLLGLRTVGEVASTVFFFTALLHMPLADLTAILQSMPVVVTLLAIVIFGEPASPVRLASVLAGLAGVLLIIRPGTDAFTVWSLFGVLAVLAVALRDMTTRALSGTVPTTTVALLASASVTLFGLLMLPFSGWLPLSGSLVLRIVGAAFFVMSGYLLIVAAARTGEVGATAPLRYTAIPFAILMGWAAFGEVPDAQMIVGAAIVAAAGLVSLRSSRRPLPNDAAPE